MHYNNVVDAIIGDQSKTPTCQTSSPSPMVGTFEAHRMHIRILQVLSMHHHITLCVRVSQKESLRQPKDRVVHKGTSCGISQLISLLRAQIHLDVCIKYSILCVGGYGWIVQ